MSEVIIHNTEPLLQKTLFFLKIHTLIAEPLDSADVAPRFARTPQLVCSCQLGMGWGIGSQSVPYHTVAL